MDSSVIKKLADIDLAARSILDEAEKEKQRLTVHYREQTEAFDRQADEESERRLKEIRSGMERDNARAIEKMEYGMEKSMAALEKNYAEQIDTHAACVVARILGEG